MEAIEGDDFMFDEGDDIVEVTEDDDMMEIESDSYLLSGDDVDLAFDDDEDDDTDDDLDLGFLDDSDENLDDGEKSDSTYASYENDEALEVGESGDALSIDVSFAYADEGDEEDEADSESAADAEAQSDTDSTAENTSVYVDFIGENSEDDQPEEEMQRPSRSSPEYEKYVEDRRRRRRERIEAAKLKQEEFERNRIDISGKTIDAVYEKPDPGRGIFKREVRFKLGDFEGPLDLMYSFCKEERISIRELLLSDIIYKYIDIVASAVGFDAEYAGEFLVEISKLYNFKSRKLLPPSLDFDGDYEGGLSQDDDDFLAPYESYEIVRQTCEKLSELEILYQYGRGPEYGKDDYKLSIKKFSLEKMVDAYAELLHYESIKEQTQDVRQKKIYREPLDVKQMISKIATEIHKKKTLLFFDLFKEDSSSAEVVNTFLAMLELIKVQYLTVTQEVVYGDILINLKEGAPDLRALADLSIDDYDEDPEIGKKGKGKKKGKSKDEAAKAEKAGEGSVGATAAEGDVASDSEIANENGDIDDADLEPEEELDPFKLFEMKIQKNFGRGVFDLSKPEYLQNAAAELLDEFGEDENVKTADKTDSKINLKESVLDEVDDDDDYDDGDEEYTDDTDTDDTDDADDADDDDIDYESISDANDDTDDDSDDDDDDFDFDLSGILDDDDDE